MAKSVDAVLAEITGTLQQTLGDNLYSCCVYGSIVRGNAVLGVSDLNLLLVLNESTAAPHDGIARVLSSHPNVDPFVVARPDLARTILCFASKFASIRRNYRVLHGADPFANIAIDPRVERLLCEQAVRNLRLRLTYAYIVRSGERSYSRFLSGSVAAIFVHLGEVLLLDGQTVPKDFAARIPLFEQAWPGTTPVLHDLLSLRQHRRDLTAADKPRWHANVLALLDAALSTIGQNRSDTTLPLV